MQNVANMMNAWGRMTTRDPVLFAHLSKAATRIAVDGFVPDAQAVSNILHAMAVLNLRDDDMLEAIVRTFPGVDHTTCAAQGIANICWSMGVLQIKDPGMLDWVLAALKHSIPDMNWSCLRQVRCPLRLVQAMPDTDLANRPPGPAIPAYMPHGSSLARSVKHGSPQLRLAVARTDVGMRAGSRLRTLWSPPRSR
eukprot:1628227-Rhodomonas_salina.1